MDSVSRPLLIALGGIVVVFALWLVVLKPKPVAIDNTPLAPTEAVGKAKAAVATSNAADATVQAATGDTPATVPAATAKVPAARPTAPATAASTSGARLDGPILRELRDGRIVVVLFWNALGADDIATRGALRELDRHDGRVVVHIVPIAKVGRYPSITEGVTVAQSPTTLVIGRRRHTRVITGLSEPRELSQAVGDALAGR